MSEKHEYNLIAIGAGAAGLVTTYIGAAVKAKVALIEKHRMGGDCLNTGCVPSKALIASAKQVKNLRKAARFGIENVQFQVNFAKVMEQVQAVIKQIEPHDSIERYTGLGVDCIQGAATLISPTQIKVNDQILTSKAIVIATGARPAVPPIPGLDKIAYLHSDNIWDLRELPQRLLVVGGGPIGCELAQAFARLGSQVTIVDILPTILAKEDPDVVKIIHKSFAEDQITVMTGIKLLKFVKGKENSKAIIEKAGEQIEIPFDKVFLATGRKANSSGFGLETIGVELNLNGTIKVDEYMRTNVPNIYACGDVAGPYQFTHMAAHQAWYCAVNALFGSFKKFKVDYSVVPWCTYTDPEIARVGLNETDAIAEGVPHEVTHYDIGDLDRAITEREDRGMVKVITPPGSDRILGVTICGMHAGDLLAEFVLAMKHDLGLNKILGTIHAYPTLAEANKFVAGEWRKKHAPETALKLLKGMHSFLR